MSLTIDLEKSKVFINDLEVNDPKKIGKAILKSLEPQEFKRSDMLEKFNSYCERLKLTPTEERDILLDIVLNLKNNFNVIDVFKQIPEGVSITERTVYYNFKLFENASIIKTNNITYLNRTLKKFYSVNSK
tara:strand:+ start:90 stop:482 length:393 start_codon:yes stop_codon:yes gene_type:complete